MKILTSRLKTALLARRLGLAAALASLAAASQTPLMAQNNPPPGADSPAAVLAMMKRVADWQLVNPSSTADRYDESAWTWGVYYTGMMALSGIADDPKYHDAMLSTARELEWKPGWRKFHADDQCVCQLYLELYLRHREPAMLLPTKQQFDDILANPSRDSLIHEQKGGKDRWWWCDALFMGSPIWARLYGATGDPRYLDFLTKEWWATTDLLYDKNEHLYYRDSRYISRREANGKKLFWCRGNGWVVSGLVRVLQYLPNNHPDRPRFEALFKDMCQKLLALQQPDGLWRASLLDPASYPLKESSGSALCIYPFAWGVNQGLLDRHAFEPAIQKGWTALAGCVQADGKLTHVQPSGADPRKFAENSSDVFGVGAFLLAGSEVYRLAVLQRHPQAAVSVANPSSFWREGETIEVKLSDLPPSGRPTPAKFAVMDGASSRILDSQLYASDSSQSLLFQADLAPHETRRFVILDAAALPGAPSPLVKTYARLVTERMNDMAWESDRQAHRMYHQDLIKGEGTISSGIDVWSKRTRNLVVDKWYKGADYHNDHGEGLDDYRVGRSRGCGGLGVWSGTNLSVSINFRQGRVLTTGPIRSEFELVYDAWDAGGRKVSEIKRIRIDAGSNLSRAQSVFTCEPADARPLDIGIGIAQRPVPGMVTKEQKGGWFAYWQPADRDRGNIGCAVILQPGSIKQFVVEDATVPQPAAADRLKPNEEGLPPVASLLAITQAPVGEPFTYWFGAGWSKSGDFPDAKSWENYIRQFAARLQQPLQIKAALN